MPESQNESQMLRLFRCMNDSEQRMILLRSIELLAARCTLLPRHQLFAGWNVDEEIKNESLDERLTYARPLDWPEREIVDMDNLGDPGEWLDNNVYEPASEVLFGEIDHVVFAEVLAEHYLRQIRGDAYPLPSDFSDEPGQFGGWTDRDQDQVANEFKDFVRHWRERVIQALEEQNRTGSIDA